MTIEFDDLIPKQDNSIGFDDLIPKKKPEAAGFLGRMVDAMPMPMRLPMTAIQAILAPKPSSVLENLPPDPGQFDFSTSSQIARQLDDRAAREKEFGTIGPIRGPQATPATVAKGLGTDLVAGGKNARAGINIMAGDIAQAIGDAAAAKHLNEQGMRERAQAGLMSAANTPEFQSDEARGIYAGVSSLVRQAPSLGAAILTRNPNIALGGMVAPMLPEEYGKFRERGGKPLESLAGAVGTTATEYLTEKLPMGFFVSKLGKAGAGEFLTGILAREMPGEQIATLVQDAIDTAVANPDKTWAEYWKERPSAAYQTALATVTQAGLMSAGNGAINRLSRPKQDDNQGSTDQTALQALDHFLAGRKLANAIDADSQSLADSPVPTAVQQTVARIMGQPLPPTQASATPSTPATTPIPALGFDPGVRNPQPTMQVDAQGNASPMPFDQVDAIQAEVERMNNLGLTPDVQRAAAQRANSPESGQAPVPSDLIERLMGAGWTPPAATPVNASATPVNHPAPSSDPNERYGIDHTPFSAGGKPFKTRQAAGKAKKLQPAMRVVSVPGGFALADKTEKQLAAEAKAAKRIAGMRSGTAGMPMSAHEFIASHGGLSRAAAADLGIEGNVKIGNRWLYAGQGKGLTIEQATQKLVEAGYIQSDSHNDALDIIRRSVASPQYTAEGWEQVAQAQHQAEFEDHLAVQHDAAQNEDFDPFTSLAEDGYLEDDSDGTGFWEANPELQAEVAALSAQLEDLGIDPYDILEPVARANPNATQDQYHELAKQTLIQAIAQASQPSSSGDPGQDDGQPSQARNAGEAGNAGQDAQPDEGLSSYTQQDIESRLSSLEQAEEERKRQDREAQQKAQADAQRNDFTLTGSDRPADVAAARGQQDIFSAPEQQAPQAPMPTPGMTPSEAIVNAFTKEGSTKADGQEMAKRIQKLADRNGKAVTLWWNPEDGELAAMGTNPFDNGVAITTVQPTPDPRDSTSAAITTPQPTKSSKSKSAVEPKSTPDAVAKNEDVGQQLYANRRNFTGRGLKWEDLQGLNETLKVKEVTKAKVWPRPNYEQLVADGMSPLLARMVKQVYDGISAGPSLLSKAVTDEHLERYIDTLAKIREGIFGFVNDKNAVGEFASAVTALSGNRSMSGPVAITDMLKTDVDAKAISQVLLRRIWPDQYEGNMRPFVRGTQANMEMSIIGGNKALGALQFVRQDFAKWGADLTKGWPGKREAWEVQGYRVLAPGEYTGVSKEQPDGTSVLSIAPKQGRGSWRIKLEDGQFGNDQFVLVQDGGFGGRAFPTREAAIEAAREKVKRKAGVGQDTRGTNIEDATRVGPERREEGDAVTSQRLMDTFGFRGVNFGREGWINQAERQAYLNQAFDGLMDLADVLGVPPKAMSLNGALGIAFGAQGKGKFAAHFVPGVNEINLTKTRGAGTLAHEWGHALDHHFANQAGLAKDAEPMLSEHAYKGDTTNRVVWEDGKYTNKKGVPTFDSAIRPEIVQAFRAIYQTMEKRNETETEAQTKTEAAKASALKSLASWLKAARSVIESSKAENKAELLAELDQHAEKMRQGDTGDGYETAGKSVFSARVAAVRTLIKEATGRLWSNDETQGLERSASHMRYLLGQDDAQRQHEPQKVSTQYKRHSAAMDKEKGGKPYWSTPTEMFARAFELYVHDKLAQKEQTNTFLSDAAERAQRPVKIADTSSAFARSAGLTRDLYLYPTEQERKDLASAFDGLVQAIETRETDKGITLNEPNARYGSPSLDQMRGQAQSEYDAVVSKYQSTEQWLKAPNGNPTKLTERQWVQVRTPSFKAWFGDWEKFAGMKGGVWNDANREVSKVVDENGEPLVVYHGTDTGGFTRFFDTGGEKRGDLGIFTTSNRDMAATYVKRGRAKDIDLGPVTDEDLSDTRPSDGTSGIYASFVNIRDAYETDFDGANWSGERAGQYQVRAENGDLIESDSGSYYFDMFDDANQVAQANPGSEVEPADDHYETTDSAVRDARKSRNDGAFIRNVVDDGGGGGRYFGEPSDVFVAFDPKQIKSADQNIGTYGADSDNILLEGGQSYNANARKRKHTNDRQLQLFLDNGPDQSQAGPAGEAAQRAAVAAVDDLRSTETILGFALSRDYAARQRVNLVGQKVSSTEDLAILAQVYRDPRFETFRVIFTNDAGRVVSQVGLTSRLPASTSAIMGNDVDAYLGDLSSAARNRGATGYYLLHNHPSSIADPSRADIVLTRTFAQKMPMLAFKSHVVIDTNEYFTIDATGDIASFKKDFGQPAPMTFDEWGNTAINSPADVMSMAKRLQVDKNAVTLISLTNQLKVKGITTIPQASIGADKAANRRAVSKSVMRLEGARVIAVGRDLQTLKHLGTIVTDAIHVTDDGAVVSLAQHGVAGGDLFPNQRRTRVSPDTSPEFAYLRSFEKQPGIKAAEPGKAYGVQSAAQSWEIPEAGAGDAFIRAIQNNKIDVKRVRDAIAKRYGNVSEHKDAYLAEELYHGKVAARVTALYDQSIEPILQKIAVAGKNVGITMDDVNTYLHARHAPERNAAMKAINPGMQDNDALSGMSDQEAKKSMADFAAAGKDKALAKIAADVDQLLHDTRTALVADGLEEAGVINAWEHAYKHYVPLQRDIKSTGTPKGMGFSVRGPESKRAVGSKREVVNILANIVTQAETAAIRAEKAEVGRTLLAMAKTYPNPDFWKVDVPPTKPRIDKDTGLVIRTAIDPMYQTADNVVMVKDYGQEHFIVFNKDNERAMAMAHAMKNLDIAPMNKILEVANKGTRFLASLLTQRNPLFWLTNFARDIQGTLVNLEGTDAEGLQREAIANLPQAFKGMHELVRGKGAGQWARYAKELQDAGGTTGYMQVFENSDKRMADLEKEVAKMNQGKADPRRLARLALEFVDDYNDIIENAVRLSVFQAARDANVSTVKAASIAKNITVNFNRKGNLTPPVNALYMFFNASVQGTARLAQALATSRKAQALVGSIAVMGFVLDALNRMAAGDDDETKRNRYDLIPEFEKSRNWIFMNPMRPGEYVKVPLPLGPHVFHNAGRLLSDAIFRKNPRNASEYGWSIASVFLDAFSPLGSSPSLGQLIAPSVLDPAVQIAENKSFTGAPVYKSADRGFGKTDPKPAYTRHFDSTPDVWIATSRALNDITGGDKDKPGIVNVEPDILKHVFYTMTGGPGRTLDQAIDLTQAGARGKDVSVNRVPLASRFYGANDDAQRERVYYDDRKHALDAKTSFDHFNKIGRPDLAKEVATELGDGDAAKGRRKMLEFSAAEKSVRKINGSIRRELERDDDGAAKAEQLRALRQRRMRVMSNTMDDE